MAPALPDSMTAVRIYEFGGPDVLKVETHPLPSIGPDDVLIHVKAVSVTWWDKAYRTGLVKPIPGRSDVSFPQQLGREASGDIVAVGANAHKFSIGDKVIMLVNPACGSCHFCLRGFDNLCIQTELPAHTTFGGYAEYISRPCNAILRAPPHISYVKLACALWSYSTVLHMIDTRANLRYGESVLVTGASGGMGTAAIQLAKLGGAHPIIALSSNPTKKESLLSAGADLVLDYKAQDVLNQIRSCTPGGYGVDIVLDNVGGPMASLGVEAAKMGGRVVLAATMGGVKIELDILKVFVKNLSVLGSRASTRRDQEAVLELIGSGQLDPIVSHVFKLEDVHKATAVLESGGHVGKIVLET